MKISIKQPTIETILLAYFFTSPIWRDLIFDKFSAAWVLNPVIILSLFGMVLIKKRKCLKQYIDIFIVYLIIFLLFFIKFFANNEMSVWMTRTYGLKHMLYWGWFLGYGVIRVQSNTDSVLDCLKKVGIVLFIYYALKSMEVLKYGYWTITQFGEVKYSKGNMSWSYGIMQSICFIAIYLVKDKRYYMIVPFIIGVIGILIYGSRGTLVALVLGTVLLVTFYHSGKMRVRNFIVIAIFSGLLIFILSDKGLNIISDILIKNGVESRFVNSLLNYTNFEETSNGRVLIWEKTWEMITKGPFWGYGVYGERNVIYSIGMRWGYCHNLFLEFLVDFGYVFGSAAVIMLLVVLIKSFIATHDKNTKLCLIIFLTIMFELLLSNSYWLQSGVWITVALCVNILIKASIEKKRFSQI